MQEMVFVALDCETTGLDPAKDKIIEVGATKFTLKTNLATFDSLFDPGTRIPAFVERLTGIKSEELPGAPKFAEKQDELAEFCRDAVLIGHNLQFDLAFLASHGLDLSENASFDTFDLASLILPKVGSLSLIALGAQFGVLHESAHRALSDAEATRDLFQALVGKARELPPTSWEQISQLQIAKSAWLPRLSALVLSEEDLRPLQSKQQDWSSSIKLETTAEVNPELAAKLRELLVNESPALLEASIDPAELAAVLAELNTPAILAVGSQFAARLLHSELTTGSSALIFAPQFYTDPKKVEQFTNRELTTTEAALAAKLLLRPDQNFYEFNLTRPERFLWDFVANEACPLASASCPLIITDHASLPELAGNSELATGNLIVLSATRLPSNLANAKSLQLDLPTLEKLAPAHEQALTIWWGLLGLLLREAEPEYGRVELAKITGLKNFAPARDAGLKFLEAARASLPSNLASNLENWLNETPGYSRQLRTNATAEITLALEPLADPATVADLAGKFKKTVLLDSALSTAPDDFKFAKKILGLPADTLTASLPLTTENCELKIVPGLPAPSEPGFAAASETKLLELLNNLPGLTTVIFNGQYALGQFFEKTHGAAQHPVFASKMSGSQGKILHELAGCETAAFLTTGSWLPPRTQNLIVVKLAFTVREGADWQTETLPEAVLGWKKLWVNLVNVAERPAEQQLLALDNRLTEKNYGKDFLKAISAEPTS
jgi:DNA polymerase III epsilon subunit family exonuclease